MFGAEVALAGWSGISSILVGDQIPAKIRANSAKCEMVLSKKCQTSECFRSGRKAMWLGLAAGPFLLPAKH